jgi:3-oxoacyl-[acyl-carrier-protein] synthase-3
MNGPFAIEIAGTGCSIPEKVVTNADFEARLDTSDEWIVQRTGIRERRWVADNQTTLTMSLDASREALREAGMQPDEIDLIVIGTVTPEHTLPSTACELQAALGCRWIPAFDVVAACSGYVYALMVAAQYVQSGAARNALVLGAETLSRIVDVEDRATAILFGDGAGAAVIRPAQDPSRAILAARLGADGARAKLIYIPAGGSAEPASTRTVNERLHYMRMQGREVYKFAVTQMQTVIEQTLADAGVGLDQLSLLVPHQSNLRIIESACNRLGLPLERVIINIDRYGNTSAASVAIGFHEARRAGRCKPGDLVMLLAFGAGLTWASALIRI